MRFSLWLSDCSADSTRALCPRPIGNNPIFENILSNAQLSLRWIVVDEKRAGFVLFGLEAHRFLPRLNGTIYELYIEPEFRRSGIARVVARQAIRELQSKSPAKIQLEVMEGNRAAAALWESLGFRKVSARYVLAETKE